MAVTRFARPEATRAAMSQEFDGLMARIRQFRHSIATPDVITQLTPAAVSQLEPGSLEALQQRIAELEQLVQGFQDSVHREAERQERRLTDLEARIEPVALAAALSKDARERGI
jgi:hypothetical protein